MKQNKVRFFGDLHGRYTEYKELIKCDMPTIQVGDFGIGFVEPPQLAEKDRFIAGNHDCPEKCKAHPNYIGDLCIEGDMFFMSGAWSIDQHNRNVGVDWWPNEELSYGALMQAIDLYEQVKPRIVVTHDCPKSFARSFLGGHHSNEKNSRTSNALDAMFEIHKPDIWVFGHHHRNIFQVVLGTRFHCIAINAFRDIDLTRY